MHDYPNQNNRNPDHDKQHLRKILNWGGQKRANQNGDKAYTIKWRLPCLNTCCQIASYFSFPLLKRSNAMRIDPWLNGNHIFWTGTFIKTYPHEGLAKHLHQRVKYAALSPPQEEHSRPKRLNSQPDAGAKQMYQDDRHSDASKQADHL